MIACGLTIGAEVIFLRVRFGDPLLTLGVLLPFLRVHREYIGDPLFGVSSPWFYFHRLLLDGREMWILPHLAFLGAAALAFALATPAERFSRAFMIYWATMLLLVYSFFIISVDQSNSFQSRRTMPLFLSLH